MSNHFKKHHPQAEPTEVDLALQEKLQSITPAPRASSLGFLGTYKLRKVQRDVTIDEETKKLAVDSSEAIATYSHNVTLQGVAIRTAISRIYGDAIVAELGAMKECHAAAVQAQKVARMSASMVNAISMNEHIAQVRHSHFAGQMTADHAEALINQIVDQHIESEDRIDSMNKAVTETTDRVYSSGLTPVKHGVH